MTKDTAQVTPKPARSPTAPVRSLRLLSLRDSTAVASGDQGMDLVQQSSIVIFCPARPLSADKAPMPLPLQDQKNSWTVRQHPWQGMLASRLATLRKGRKGYVSPPLGECTKIALSTHPGFHAAT